MSSVVGAMFMILIVGVVASGYFMFTLAQNTTYNNAIRSNNQAQLVAMSESVKIPSPATYTQSGNNVQVSVTLRNDGPVNVQVQTLWVSSSATDYGFANLALNLKPGASQTINQLVTSANGVLSASNCYGWVVTARGRTFELYPDHGVGPQGPKGDTGAQGIQGIQGVQGVQGIPGSTSYDANTALVSQGIGSIAMNFKTFRTYIVDASNHLTAESPAYTFSRANNVAFKLNVTNMDPTGDIKLKDQSCIWIFSPASGAIKGIVWKIATVSNNVITPLTPGQSVTLVYNVSQTLYFGPVVAGNNNLDAGITGVNLILTGSVGTYDYGQNLPFISLIAT